MINKFKVLIFIIIMSSSQLIFCKTFSYTTYYGFIKIDDMNNQVVINRVFGGQLIYNIYDVKENPTRLYISDDYNNLCLEFPNTGELTYIKIYIYKNSRFELYNNSTILASQIYEKEPSIEKYQKTFMKPIKELIVKGEYGGNTRIFESDVWFKDKSVEQRAMIFSSYLKDELIRAKKAFNNEFTNEYDDYYIFSRWIENGDYYKLINYLSIGDFKSLKNAKWDLYKITIPSYFFYYFDNKLNVWKSDFSSEP